MCNQDGKRQLEFTLAYEDSVNVDGPVYKTLRWPSQSSAGEK